MGLLTQTDPMQTQVTTATSPTPTTSAPTAPTAPDAFGTPEKKKNSYAQNLQYTQAQKRQVQNRDTVQGQLKNILRSDSPLMKIAGREGRAQAAGRGLLNTSLAAEASQLGMMREARPVAEQDAAAYLKQGMANQEFENQFRQNRQETGLQNWLSGKDTQRKMQEMTKETRLQNWLEKQGFGREKALNKQETQLQNWLETQGFGREKELNKQETQLKDWLEKQGFGREIALMEKEGTLKDWLAQQEFGREVALTEKKSMLENWLGAQSDERKKGLMKQEFDQQRKLLEDEYGFKSEETAGKQNAALWAQFIQAAAEINTADMPVADKKRQIDALKAMTLDGMATNAKQFNDPEMYNWIVKQMGSVQRAGQQTYTPTSSTFGGSSTTTNTVPQTYSLTLNKRVGGYFGTTRYDPGTYDFKIGDPLPPGYSWGIDPKTGGYGIIGSSDYSTSSPWGSDSNIPLEG